MEPIDRVLAPARPSTLQHAYRALLKAHQTGRDAPWRWKNPFETAIRVAAGALAQAQRMRFPDRRIDSWLWTARWQFEILTRWNEWESVIWCRWSIPPGAVVIDVGAHVGYYTKLFSELAGPSGKVIAVEAHPENQEILRYNLQGRKNVEMLGIAAAASDGVATLHVSAGSSNHSLVSGYGNSQSVVTTPTRSLDSVLADRGVSQIDFIKIDVEGGEPQVLAGLARTIARSSGLRMLIEYNPAALSCGGIEPESLLQQLAAVGLQAYRLEADASLTRVSGRLGPETVNLLCWKVGSSAQ